MGSRDLRRYVEGLSPAERRELRKLLTEVGTPASDTRDVEPAGASASPRTLLPRPRLAAALDRRFEVAVTTVVAPAGFGKSTLLAQAMSARRPGTIDVEVRVRPGDDPTSVLGRIVAEVRTALSLLGRDGPTSVGDLVNLLWSAAPLEVCVVLDDLHRLDDTQVRALCEPLVSGLPVNAHVVFVSRSELACPLERLRAAGGVLSLGEADLSFTDDEIALFLQSRGADHHALATTRWPALLELACHAGHRSAERYVREEVLSAIDAERQTALCRLSVLTAFDDELVRRLTAFPGTATELVADLPLVVASDREIVLHDLWLEVLRGRLAESELEAMISESVELLAGRGELERAWALALTNGHDRGVLTVARVLALDFMSNTAVSVGAEILRRAPQHLSDQLEIAALRSAVAFGIDPAAAPALLAEVATRAAVAGDTDLFLLSTLRLAELAFRSAGFDELERAIADLERAGDRDRRHAAVLAMVTGWQALLNRDYPRAASTLARPEVTAYTPVADLAEWYSICWLGWIGHSRQALERLAALEKEPSGRFAKRIQGYVAIQRWLLGELTAADREQITAVVHELDQRGERHLFIEAAAVTALFHASAGDVSSARELVLRARRVSEFLGEHHWGSVALAQAEAVLALFDGDEPSAAALLRATIPATGRAPGSTAHLERLVLSVAYALVPASRQLWDEVTSGPDLSLGLAVGRALVAGRAGDLRLARELPWHEQHRLRPFAFEPHLLELAVMAIAAGERRAETCLVGLRADPRGCTARLLDHPVQPVRDTARRLLRTLPMRPVGQTSISVLGPLAVTVAGVPAKVTPRCRDLLALLVHHRRISREVAADRIWPSKTARDAANNLRVTLAHLTRSLEPGLEPHSPPWHIRSEGDDLVLVVGELLEVDCDSFKSILGAARLAEDAGRPDEAVDLLVAACRLYRGDYLQGWTSIEVGFLEALHLRAQFVRAATRAAELLNARRRFAEARELAARASDSEPLDVAATCALAAAFLGEGHLAGAAGVVRRHAVELSTAGITPTHEIRQLAQRAGIEL